MKIYNSKDEKIVRSKNYNYNFDKHNGLFIRWGKDIDDDPDYSPIGPEILDIEISTSVHNSENYPEDRLVYDGGCKGQCSFCYKSNGNYPTYNMTFDEFKEILHKMGPQLTQIAFGIMNINTNPDFFEMAKYARKSGIIPNFTMHCYEELTDDMARKIASYFGAVAISYYDKGKTFRLVDKLYKNGMKQINIHFPLMQETYSKALDLINTFDDKHVNAIIFLSLKQKGRGENHNILNKESFKHLVNKAINYNVPIGFDSCSANKFLDNIENRSMYEEFVEPCESGLFSSYINAKGEFFPCSFLEEKNGISVLFSNNFFQIWNSEEVKQFRKQLIENNRKCPRYII